MVSLTFTGGRELVAALRSLPAIVATEILETAVVAAAGLLRTAVAAKAPRPATRRRPGTVRLADSFKVTVIEKDRAHTVVQVGTRVPYAHLVEYGHQIVPRGPTRATRVSVTRVSAKGRTTKRWEMMAPEQERRRALRAALKQRRAGGSRGFVAARPFLRPAFDEQREPMVRRMAEVLGRGIETWWRRQPTVRPARAA